MSIIFGRSDTAAPFAIPGDLSAEASAKAEVENGAVGAPRHRWEGQSLSEREVSESKLWIPSERGRTVVN